MSMSFGWEVKAGMVISAGWQVMPRLHCGSIEAAGWQLKPRMGFT
jgi:hypothetical protein